MTAKTPETKSDETIHILDLPQLYTRPSCESLLSALDMLAVGPPDFQSASSTPLRRTVTATSHEIAAYLTRIVSSPLHWLCDEDAETIRGVASRRLSERSGRTGMGSFTRSFSIPLLVPTDGHDSLEIQLHEPALTGDDLGHKTWSSSYAVAKLLPTLLSTLHPCAALEGALPNVDSDTRVTKSNMSCTCVTLELGAGTGLLGLAYAALTHQCVLLTDLPEIVPNLARNLALNQACIPPLSSRAQLQHASPRMACGTLDWTSPLAVDLRVPQEEAAGASESCNGPLGAQLILVADPIYSPEHPRLLVDAVMAHLAPPQRQKLPARVLVAYPVSRAAYLAQIAELKALLRQHGLVVVREGIEENVRDDWDESVVVEWTIWGWAPDPAEQVEGYMQF